MNKLLACIAIVWTMSFFASCSSESDNGRISGSSEEPNMFTADGDTSVGEPTPSVFCRRYAAQGALPSEYEGCYWTGEMWNPTSGYRVRTGYDNGTNTSGIWYWSVEPHDDRDVYFNWGVPVNEEYDSLSLAPVVDRCKGSMCGNVIFEEFEVDADSLGLRPFYVESSRGYLEFSFAGKNANGEFESVDATDMQGICIEYLGSPMRMELDAGQPEGEPLYGVLLTNVDNQGAGNGKGVCYPWNKFWARSSFDENLVPSMSLEDVLAHLKGLRFSFESNSRNWDSKNFNIVALGKISGNVAAALNTVDEDCRAESVKEYYCECSYTEERISREGRVSADRLLFEKANSTEVYSSASRKCFSNAAGALMMFMNPISSLETPCDNPVPKTILCSDGSEKLSREYAETLETFEAKVDSVSNYIRDSVFALCENLPDVLTNGDTLPDTCEIMERIVGSGSITLFSLQDSNFTNGSAKGRNDYKDVIDSLYGLDTLDEITKGCLRNQLPYQSRLQSRRFARPPTPVIMTKSYRCQSGTLYYTEEFKQLLKDNGFDEYPDSAALYQKGYESGVHMEKSQLEMCIDYKKGVDLEWDGSMTRVITPFDNGRGSAGLWFLHTDSIYGGHSRFALNRDGDEYKVVDWGAPDALDNYLTMERRLYGTAYFSDDTLENGWKPFVELGFWLADENENGEHKAVDLSEREGICFEHASSDEIYIVLDMGDSLKSALDDDFFKVYAIPSSTLISDCYSWNKFKQGGWGAKMDLSEALKHVVAIKILFYKAHKDEISYDLQRVYFKKE